MASPERIIEQLTDLIESRINTFNAQMPKIQQDAFNVILELTADLETANGRIKPSLKNIRTIAKIKAELNKTIFRKEYSDELDELVKTYSAITKLQNQYFGAMVDKYTVPKVLKEVQDFAIESIIDSLGEDAIGANFTTPVRDILIKNVTTGGTKAEFIEQVRDFVLGNDELDGKLVKYTKQIVSDSLNQYSRNYNQIVSDDLGFEWFQYSGQVEETTRDFCKALIQARDGCLPFIHKSQLPEIVEGKICGEQVPIYDRTGLPQGMYPGTNAANFQTYLGGYNCRHQLNGVPSRRVPAELRAQFEGE